MSRTKHASRPLPPADYVPEYDDGYGATAVAWKKPPSRGEVMLRSFGVTVACYLIPMLAVAAGPGRTATLPGTTTPRPLLLLVLAGAILAAATQRVCRWYVRRQAATK